MDLKCGNRFRTTSGIYWIPDTTTWTVNLTPVSKMMLLHKHKTSINLKSNQPDPQETARNTVLSSLLKFVNQIKTNLQTNLTETDRQVCSHDEVGKINSCQQVLEMGKCWILNVSTPNCQKIISRKWQLVLVISSQPRQGHYQISLLH